MSCGRILLIFDNVTCKSNWIRVKSSLGERKEQQWPSYPPWCVRKFRLSSYKDLHNFRLYVGLFVALCRTKLVLFGAIKIRWVVKTSISIYDSIQKDNILLIHLLLGHFSTRKDKHLQNTLFLHNSDKSGVEFFKSYL